MFKRSVLCLKCSFNARLGNELYIKYRTVMVELFYSYLNMSIKKHMITSDYFDISNTQETIKAKLMCLPNLQDQNL